MTVAAGTSCNWTSSSNDSWITINSGAGGTGNGTVNYSVAANVGGIRNGSMTIAGHTFTVSQSAPGCNYSVLPISQNFIAAGGTGSVIVTAGAGCNWTASSNDSWITITSGNSGSGDGSVGYSVAANTGPGRSGTMTIADQTVTITQDSGCSFGISPSSANYTTSGGSGSVTVTANNQSCPWGAISNNPSWITVTSGASGIGNGTVSYSVASNSGVPRSGSISIATQSLARWLEPDNPRQLIDDPNVSFTDVRVDFSRWTRVQGVLWPYEVTHRQGGRVDYRVVINRVLLNQSLGDSIFQNP